MTEQHTFSNQSVNTQKDIYTDFLDRILDEDNLYPWEPEISKGYYEITAEESPFFNYLESDEIEERVSSFFSQIHEMWPSNKIEMVRESLLKQFGKIAPSRLLEAIASNAENIVNQNLSELDQLIECVKPTLLNWGEEELQLFARPVAFAMRDSQQIPEKEWEQLTSVQQARLSMIIAKSALEAWKQAEEE